MKISTFYDAWRIRAKYLPPETVSMIHGSKKITWKESMSRINRLAAALRNRGVRKNDKVGILFHNTPDFVVANMAVQALGAVPVPINYRYVADELEFVLDHCDAVCLIYEADAVALVDETRPRLKKVHTFISTAPNLPTGTFDFDKIIAESEDKEIWTEIAGDDVAVIIFTGGTTGRPKGVMLTYDNLLINQVSVVNMLLRLLPPVADLGKDAPITNAVHRKLLSFAGDMLAPLKPVMKPTDGGRGPILCVQLTAPGIKDLPIVTAMMVGGEVKLYAGAPEKADLTIKMDMGPEYRSLSDQGVYRGTAKGRLAMLPILLGRLAKGEMSVKGDLRLLLKAVGGDKGVDTSKPITNLLNVPPLFHLAAYAFWLTFVVHQQGAVIFPENFSFDPKEVLDLVQEHKVTWTLMVPAMWKKIVAYEGASKYDLSSVKVALSGAALLNAHMKREILKLFPNALVLDGFGQTEMAPVTSMKVDGSAEDVKERSVGKILDGVEVKIVDDTGMEVPDGQNGELMYRSKTVMKGYYGDEESTRKVLDKDGWFRSGDLAYRGKDGEIYVIERKGECINSGGEKIFPLEVEEILYKHPKVDSACVVGLPDEDWGERVVAVIVPKHESHPTQDEIIDYCVGKMAGYKKPKNVIFVEALPLSPVGKVLRAKVRQIAGDRLAK